MIIFIILIVAFAIGQYLLRTYRFDMGGIIVCAISGVCLAIATLMIIINHTTYRGYIAEYDAIKSTIESARNDSSLSDVERAALTTTIIAVNKDIATTAYFNNTIIDIFIPDELVEKRPLLK